MRLKIQLRIKNVGAALAAAQLRIDERSERRDRLWAIPSEEEVFLRSEKIKNEINCSLSGLRMGV